MSKSNKIKEKFIRTSKHSTKFTNFGKLCRLEEFISEYRRVAQIFLDFLWDNKYTSIDSKGVEHTLDRINQIYNVPNHIHYNDVPYSSWLSGRAINSLSIQVLGAISSRLEEQRARLYRLNKIVENKEEIPFDLLKNIVIGEPRKPKIDKINPELSSNNIDLQKVNGHFNIFIRMKCLWKLKEFKIPIKFHKQSEKWRKQSRMLGSVLISKNHIELRWEFEKKKKTTGIIVGADQGKNIILALSDGQTTPDKDIHGHSLSSIMKKMSRRKKGSKNFRKIQKHRENFINWSLNQLDLSKINQVNYEEILNLRFGKSVSRYMSHWTYTIQDKKFQEFCDEAGVQVNHSSSACKSQRCSECGFVHYLNRKGKKFKCRNCEKELNADFNSSCNHEIELPSVKDFVMSSRMNRTSGFFWKVEGIFGIEGKELRVHNAIKTVNNL